MLDTWVFPAHVDMRGPKVPLGSKDARTVGCWENDGQICCSFWTLNTLSKSIHFDSDVAHASVLLLKPVAAIDLGSMENLI